MSEECTHDCSTCGKSCGGAEQIPEDLHEEASPFSDIKHVIGVVSGKGGVGKSLVTSMLAVEFKRRGYSSAVLDADVTGPSIPKAFGIDAKAEANDNGILPVYSKTGIPVMSVNLLLPEQTDPVVWRGPVISGLVKQFWKDVIWGDVDYMFIDMPPGTGDVPLTVFQTINLDGIIIVTSPQELVSMVVQKACKMAELMNIPVYGIVENMSYLPCPDCGKKIYMFGESKTSEIASNFGIPLLAEMPVNSKLAAACDGGLIELFEDSSLDNVVTEIIGKTK